MAEWRTIESAPKDEDPVLAWNPSAYMGAGTVVVALWHDGRWRVTSAGWAIEPTHWMPLPGPPEPFRIPGNPIEVTTDHSQPTQKDGEG